MEDLYLLGLGLLVAGFAMIAGIIWYQTAGKARRRRRLEREHFKSKTR